VRRPLERTVVLALWITCIVVLPVLLLSFYVVCRSKSSRFKLSATLLTLVSINIEVDAEDKPKGARMATYRAEDPGGTGRGPYRG
jgi:hypothetical protein